MQMYSVDKLWSVRTHHCSNNAHYWVWDTEIGKLWSDQTFVYSSMQFIDCGDSDGLYKLCTHTLYTVNSGVSRLSNVQTIHTFRLYNILTMPAIDCADSGLYYSGLCHSRLFKLCIMQTL